MTNCQYFPKCTGCSSRNDTYSQQKISKISHLQSLLKENDILTDEPEFISCGESGLRHRIDFTIEFNQKNNQHTTGFYDHNKNLINIEQCLQLDQSLQRIYSEFIQFKFFYNETPIKKGSVRLRISPAGKKGCWLDFSNIDIKCLLEDKKLLNDLLDANYIVEIGQKGKKLHRHDDQLKLTNPTAEPWFQTIDSSDEKLNLSSLISDFTQPSWVSAAALVKIVLDWTNELRTIKTILEFGSGIGQFTLSFLKEDLTVDACEINESATTQLLINAKSYQLENKLSVHLGDFHKKNLPADKKYDLIFVNPARSGLRKFTEEILKTDTDYLIYVSCFPETLVGDIAALSGKYKLCNIKIVDQFPQTKHFETCALLKKLN